MRKIKIFTHTDLDGIGCAILAYLAFGRENVDIEYCGYDNIDAKVMELLGNRELYDSYDAIYITDISVSDEVALEIDALSYIWDSKIELYDHHATALRLSEDYDWAFVRVCDPDTGIKTSGTELFYKELESIGCFDKYFKTTRDNIARFVEIVRDYDTWRWKEELGEDGIACKNVNDLLYIYGREVFIDLVMKTFSTYLSPLHIIPAFGPTETALLEQKQKDIDFYIAQKDKQLVKMEDQFGYTYGLVFAERYFSELGNKLSELHPELDYIAMIDIADGKVSYRTVKDNLDLGGEIAHSFGGGGHKKAAGSVFDGGLVIEMVVREVFK